MHYPNLHMYRTVDLCNANRFLDATSLNSRQRNAKYHELIVIIYPSIEWLAVENPLGT